MKYWGNWVLEKARAELAEFYPPDPDGSVPVAYLWARTVNCPNPTCGATIPLVRQLWLCKKPKRKVALRMTPSPETKRCEFTVVEGKEIDFDPTDGTMLRGDATCPFCSTTISAAQLRETSRAGKMNRQLMAVVTVTPGTAGKRYRAAAQADALIDRAAAERLTILRSECGDEILPGESLPPVGTLGFRVNNYGLTEWRSLFTTRQLLVAANFVLLIRELPVDHESSEAIRAYLSSCVAKVVDRNCTLCTWQNTGEKIGHVFGRQALPMVWDFVESNPLGRASGNWGDAVLWNTRVIEHASGFSAASVTRGSAEAVPIEADQIDAVVTDPPYYDAVPYADLSDFFYVWHNGR